MDALLQLNFDTADVPRVTMCGYAVTLAITVRAGNSANPGSLKHRPLTCQLKHAGCASLGSVWAGS